MNEILKVNYETEQPTVSARDLYEKVGTTERFSSWFERQLQFGFEQNKDYSNPQKVLRVQIEGNREVQREVEDYDLTIEMAKEVCMIQKNESAREIRKYLIKINDAWNTPEKIMARALEIAHKTIDDMKKKNIALLEDNETMKPKAEYFDELVDRNLLTSFRITAKEFGIKESTFIKWLLENKYIFRDQNKKLNTYAKWKEQGLFEIKEYKSRHSKHAGTQTLLTPKGRETFRILLSGTKI